MHGVRWWRLYLVIGAVFIPGVARSAGPAKPNILVLLADDLGYSDLGCYGGEIPTPHLDALAKNGLRFTQFYNTARCWPSRAALLTGYYAQQVRRDSVPGVVSGGRGVRPAWARLLPEMLKEQGYRSYHSGKWHVDGLPTAQGFEHSYRLDDHGRYFHPQRHSLDEKALPAIQPGRDFYTTTEIAQHAITWLREHAEKHTDKPFFQFVAFTAPHFPLHALPEDYARHRDRYRAGWDEIRAERVRRVREMGLITTPAAQPERDVGPPYAFPEAIKKLGPGEVNRPIPWAELTPEQRDFQAAKMALHAALVDRMDREIGRILDTLRSLKVMDETLILFLSDNGASAEIMVRDDGHDPTAPPGSAKTHLCLGPGWSTAANAPLRRHKTWVHEGGIATPLVVHWPRGLVARGEVRHTPAHLVDLVPTFLEVSGAKRLKTWAGQPVPPPPGRSLVPVFPKDQPVTATLWWAHEGNRALRQGNWKVVASGEKAEWELYDLAADRCETNNLATQNPQKVRELGALWTKSWEEYRALAARDLPPTKPGAKPERKP